MTALAEVQVIPIEALEDEPAREVNRRRPYTPEECIRLARIWSEATGAPPAQKDWNPALRRRTIMSLLGRIRQHRDAMERYGEGGYPSDVTVRKLFGSWNAFLHAAGWEPRGPGRPRMTAPESPKTPTREQVRRRVGLQAERAPYGRESLAHVVRKVLEAEKASDRQALKGILLDGAAQLLAWADSIPEELA